MRVAQEICTYYLCSIKSIDYARKGIPLAKQLGSLFYPAYFNQTMGICYDGNIGNLYNIFKVFPEK